MNEENNEEVVNDVPETSEEKELEVQVNASQDEENQVNDDIEKQIEERANELFEEKVKDRLARDRAVQERKHNKELSQYKELANVVQAGLGVNSLDEAIQSSSRYYTEQGIDIPKYKDAYSEKREERLAKVDAQEIIDLGREEMEEEANRLAQIPLDKQTTYERTVFNTLCEKLTEDNQIKELQAKGIDTSILSDKEFKAFKEQFTSKTPITDIYNMYQLKNKPIEKPASAGSAKSESGDMGDTFSPERINEMSPTEMMKYWNDPNFRKVAGLN